MRTSKVVEGWMTEAQANLLLKQLAARFKAFPDEVKDRILAAKSPGELEKYGEDFAQSESLEDFRKRSGL
jgi:hypothetical protein